MWKRRVDGGSVSGGRITLLLRIKWVCMREKARDIFCSRDLLASAAFHSLPHLFFICFPSVKLLRVKRTFLYTPCFSFFFFFCWLFLGWSKGCTQVAKRKASDLPGWRALKTVWLPDQVSCHVLTLCFCMRAEIVQSYLQTHTVWGSMCSQHRQTDGNSLLCNLIKHFHWSFYLASFFCYFCILLIDTNLEPLCLSSAVSGCPCTPYGPLCILYEAKALSTTIWFKRGNRLASFSL